MNIWDFITILFSGFHFQNPEFFYLFLLIPILILLELQRKKLGIKFKDYLLLKRFYSQSSLVFYFQLILKIIILSFFILILANPGVTNIKQEVIKKGIDISLVLDISKSMLAEDVRPNRIEAAKKVIGEFIAKLNSDRLSIVIFAGKPFTSIPLTFDYNVLTEFIKNITTDSINQNMPGLSGTAIGDSIILASDSLEKGSNVQDKKREKIIILITDGEANVGIDPKIATKYAKEKGVKIYTIGIGSKDGTQLFTTDSYGNKQYFIDTSGNPILAKLDEELLKKISSMTNGEYFNADSSDTLKTIFEKLGKLNKTEIKTIVTKEFHSKYNIFLVILIIGILTLFWLDIKFKIVT